MNKKIVLLLLTCCNSALPAPWVWESIKEQVSKNADRVSAGIIALAALSAGVYAYAYRSQTTQTGQPHELTAQQKFLSMLANAIESDLRRLDCAIAYQQPFDIQYDALHVWNVGTQNAAQEWNGLYDHARTLAIFQRYLRTHHEVAKARETLRAFQDAVNKEKNKIS